MDFDAFIRKYTGVGIDTDGAFGNQCIDLMHKYCQEVLGLQDLSILASPDAKRVWTNFNNVKGHELFTQILNTPTGVPLKGDIILYGNNPNGHVDIFIQGDANSYRSFSQNLPTGSKSNVINHPNYNNVLGWLRYKGQPQDALRVCLADREKFWKERDQARLEVETLKKKIEDLQFRLERAEGKIQKAQAALI